MVLKKWQKGKSKDFVTTSVSGKGGQTNIPYRYPLVRDADGNVINHPYTSTYLMPTCYTESVRKKVQTQAIDYDENTFIVNSYEARLKWCLFEWKWCLSYCCIWKLY